MCCRRASSGADFEGAYLVGATFIQANFRGAKMNRTVLVNARYKEADIEGLIVDDTLINDEAREWWVDRGASVVKDDTSSSLKVSGTLHDVPSPPSSGKMPES